MKQIIIGSCPSKSNGYRIGGKSFYKTKAVTDYEKSFYMQCNHYRNKNIEGYFDFYIDAYFKTMANDLDNSLKVVLDNLQKCKAIKNDNRCIRIVANKFVDKTNPRIEFEIKEVKL